MTAASDFVEELKHSVKAQDQIKLQIVLEDFARAEPSTQRIAVFELNRATSDFLMEPLAKALYLHPELEENATGLWQTFVDKILEKPALADSLIATNNRECGVATIRALAAIRSESTVAKLTTFMSHPDAKLRNLAKEKLAGVGPMAVLPLTQMLSLDDNDAVIHALNVLADLAEVSAVAEIRALLLTQPTDANVRFAAYEALGMMPVGQGAYTLTEGIVDEDDSVAVAAARAIDYNWGSVLRRGMQNLIRTAGDSLMRYVEVIVTSESDNILFDVLPDQRFAESFVQYLNSSAPQDVKERLLKQLRQKSFTEVADLIEVDLVVEETRKATIWAVDDSKMILRMYKKVLHELDYQARFFSRPADALTELDSEVPDLIVTDLNMPEIDGFELACTVRARFAQNAVPIIMVTTQSDASERMVPENGVNQIVGKPFSAKSLGPVIEKWLEQRE